MYKGGKNHIKHSDFLNFYMPEKGREGDVTGIKQNIKVWRSAAMHLCKSKYVVLMVCVFVKAHVTKDGGVRARVVDGNLGEDLC